MAHEVRKLMNEYAEAKKVLDELCAYPLVEEEPGITSTILGIEGALAMMEDDLRSYGVNPDDLTDEIFVPVINILTMGLAMSKYGERYWIRLTAPRGDADEPVCHIYADKDYDAWMFNMTAADAKKYFEVVLED